MDTIVVKFGGSSVADNIKLNVVANKIIEFYKEGNNVVVVVSAQRKNYWQTNKRSKWTIKHTKRKRAWCTSKYWRTSFYVKISNTNK